MAKALDDFIAELPPKQQRDIEEQSEQLIAEYKTLMEMRQLCSLTQIQVAKNLGMTQGAVAGVEKRDDLLLSTLSKYVQAIGGSLDVVVNLKDGSKFHINPSKIEKLHG